MAEDRPPWARRMTNDREARGWSQAEAVRAMRAHAPGELPNDPSLLRQWKRWEAGEVHAQRLLSADHRGDLRDGHPCDVPGPAPARCRRNVLAMAGMDTLELVSRLQRSDLDQAT